MAQLVIEIPDELARQLEDEAAMQHASVSEVATERLLAANTQPRPGSQAALLNILNRPQTVDDETMEEFLEVLRAQEPPEKRYILYPRRK
ncbi:MAG: hypothetical protein FJW38_04610 [Acidobacteria bacterium]|nr:hypothetical protein [Acidobacteriota bacterium]